MTTDVTTPSSATLGEIHQQPRAWRDLAVLLDQARGPLDAFLERALRDPRTRVVLTGAGTSAFVGRIVAESLRGRLHRRFDAVSSTDIVADPRTVLAEDVPVLLVSFARSGNSPESAAATELVDAIAPSAHHLVVTCDPTGALAVGHRDREDSFVLTMPPQTNDTGFAMTSSFSSMLLAALLAFVPSDAAELDRVVATGERALAAEDGLDRILDRSPRRIVFLGGGALAGLAEECALKTLELTAGTIAAFHDTPLGFRHGPKAVLDDETVVVVLRSADPRVRRYDDDIVREIRADRPDQVVVVGADEHGTATDLDLVFPEAEGLDDGLRAVGFVAVAQLLALHASVRLGCTPDNPFPDGTVNRVVRGVTIHPLEAVDPARGRA
ncbi:MULTISPECIES: SIS domain-containing protein [unclassified Curtobacterium]|uniref:SIS domain-containing protein n=1 Tax=unclassified Curtobacterium TaxID=257496 RepID=UPI0008DD3459|nr:MULTISPECIES: SIS domain-containing protein [unclassified Curtobacterium]OIH92937.1 hypothetical protein BIU92_08575 [Curtobacterium sp. MCBA15_003]OII11024.1 hypothetical protein BIU97_09205 [Curtobacterium sp. MCBA15_009]OII29850.1 hypothetical protein BIU94_09315 [Curtobacterium sp. MMLR14_006]